MKIAKRLAGITESPTLAVMQAAQRLKQQGVDVMDFGPGEPDFPTPEPIRAAAIAAIQSGYTKYTAAAGIQELRQAVADKYNREWGSDYTVANVIITCGAKHAIYNYCMALFEAGEDVIVPAPYWVTFPEIVKMTGARPVEVATAEKDGFVLDPDSVKAAVRSSSTRGLLLNTPNNPTGAVIPQGALSEIVATCRKWGVHLLSDETYECFVYEGRRHHSLAALARAADECLAICGSVSKTYSMTGWRIGYIVAHRDLIRKISEFQSHQTGNPTSISQKAAVAALQSSPELVEEMKKEYEKRRLFVLSELEGIPGFSCAKPYGAFYAFPNVSGAMKSLDIATSEEFSQFLIEEARVAVVPGSAFGMEGFIRLSYATSMENLREGLSRIRSAMAKRVQRVS